MNNLSRIVAILLGIGLIYAAWGALEVALLSPKRAAETEIRELQNEIATLMDRGNAALHELRLTKQLPSKQGLDAVPVLTSDLQQVVRDAVVSSGGDLISSQLAQSGRQALVRARLDEGALIRLVRSIEVAPGNIRFLSLDIQPVPTPEVGTVLEVTAMVQRAD